MAESGYYRYPTIHRNTVVFVSEDDLWSVPASGGVARRLTSNLGQTTTPSLSPDGSLLAFTGREEGHSEVYVMAADGGPAQRLTYLGAHTWVAGWTPDGQKIIFASNTGQPFARIYWLYQVDREGGNITPLPTGPAQSISFGPRGGIVIGRNTTDLARWKRYRGGLTGDLWIDPTSEGEWRRLIQLAGNVAQPLWVGERIYFVSDHEGVGNLYSCTPDGEDVRRHTRHASFYVRHPATDGIRIVYHAGADLYVYDRVDNSARRIEVEFHSPRAQCKRKFVDASRYLQGYAIHPEGHSVALITRGKLFTMSNWEGAALQYGTPHGVRYRLASWLNDGQRLVTVSDAAGDEVLEIHHTDPGTKPVCLENLDIGRPRQMTISPHKDEVALTNHRNELLLIDVEAGTMRVLDRSRYGPLRGISWSPDGRWLAYGYPNTRQTSQIKLCLTETGETWEATRPVLRDVAPVFDPEGKYLYFLSYREFDPVYDSLQFDLNFPGGMRPCLITLQASLPSPFVPMPRTGESQSKAPEKPPPTEQPAAAAGEPAPPPTTGEASGDSPTKSESPQKEKPRIQIDVEGISDRVVAFPVRAGSYGQIAAIKGKVLYSSYPIEGSLGSPQGGEPPARGRLDMYDLEERTEELVVEGITGFRVSRDNKRIIYRTGNRLRVIKAGERAPGGNGAPSRKTGWLDLSRLRVAVMPRAEWQQMYREAWRMQRDHFWSEDMSGVDWQLAYRRYQPLLDRVGTRAEFSDLLWEMQGELGTSHAYEYGGDYRPEPRYPQGFLGATLDYDAEIDAYRFLHIVKGDSWDEEGGSPLQRPGINLKPGDRLLAINGRRLSKELPPAEMLVNQAGTEVLLTLANASGENQRHVAVKTLRSETAARYREWVEAKQHRVHEASQGRVGYVHIPDMSANGYAEFHRGFLAEVDRQGLIVDVRYNSGGHVSQLILEKLARRRLGYDVQRWSEPVPYPTEALMGPIVALANEHASSDGDMFSHAFKQMRLGPLIGKRTWGGVVGIWVRDSLVDGGITTQPEFSHWFEDVGWEIENFGTTPTIEVEVRPQDYVNGRDPQLERALQEILQHLESSPPKMPDFGARPRLPLPDLPET